MPIFLKWPFSEVLINFKDLGIHIVWLMFSITNICNLLKKKYMDGRREMLYILKVTKS